MSPSSRSDSDSHLPPHLRALQRKVARMSVTEPCRQVDDDPEGSSSILNFKVTPPDNDADTSPIQLPSSLLDQLGTFDSPRLIGSGGMGAVFEVTERDSGQAWAVKTLHRLEPRYLARLKSEFRSLTQLPPHPNVINVAELVVDDSAAAFTMDFIDGQRFADAMMADTSMKRRRQLLIQLADGLHHLHCHGILHCDLKSSNVLVTADDRVVLLDFGLSAWLNGSANLPRDRNPVRDHTPRAYFLGTLAYVSPEQAEGKALAPASDWFAYGVLMARSLTDRFPHEGEDTAALLANKRSGNSVINERESNESIPSNWLSLIRQLLLPDPDARPSYEAVCQQLRDPGVTVVLEPVHQAEPLWIPSPTLVGRKNELEQFVEPFRHEHVSARLIDVVGESGIGKSAFLSRATDMLDSDRAIVMAKCFHQEKVPFPGMDQLVDRLVELVKCWPASWRMALIDPSTASCTSLFPALRQLQACSSLKTLERSELPTRGVAVQSFVNLVTKICQRISLCLVIDDMQWANQETAHLLEQLIHSRTVGSLTIVTSRRPDSGPTTSAIDQTLTRLRHVFIPLGPLDFEACRQLIFGSQEVTGLDTSPGKTNAGAKSSEWIDAINQCGGNPLHLHELSKYLHQVGVASRRDALSYNDILAERVGRLTTHQRSLLQLVASSSFPIEIDAIARLFRSSPTSTIRFLTQNRLLSPSADCDQVEVFHSQVGDVVRSHTPPDERQQLHEQLAQDTREHDSANYRLLSEQLRRCGRRHEAAETLMQAAAQSSDRFAYHEAVSILGDALTLCDHLPSRIRNRVRERQADAQAMAGKCGDAADNYRRLTHDVDEADRAAYARKAIFHYLVNDQLDLRLDVVNEMGRFLGLRISDQPHVAVVKSIAYRIATMFTRAGKSKPPSPIGHQLELLQSATRALLLTNPLVGNSLSAKLVFLTKRYGTKLQWQAALDLDMIFVRSMDLPWPIGAFCQLVARKHRNDRLQSDSPAIRARMALSDTITGFCQGNLGWSLHSGEQALEYYQTRPADSIWELEVLSAMRDWAYHWSGQFRRLETLIGGRRKYLGLEIDETDHSDGGPEFREQELTAMRRLPGYLQSRMSVAILHDDLATAKATMDEVDALLRHPSSSGRRHELSYCQHYYWIYQLDFESALKSTLRQRKSVWRIGYSQLQIVHPGLACYEIAARTAMATLYPSQARLHQRALRKLARRLRRGKCGFEQSLARVLRAYRHSIAGRWSEMDDSVSDAIELLEKDRFDACSNFLRYAAGLVGRTPQQHCWHDESHRWFQDAGVVNPNRFHRIAAPTFANVTGGFE